MRDGPLVTLLPALLLAGCADPLPRSRVVPLVGARVAGAPAAGRVAVVEDEQGRWLAYRLAREDFMPLGASGVWRAPRAAAGDGRLEVGSAGARLYSGGRVIEGYTLGEGYRALEVPSDGAFAVGGGFVYVQEAERNALPASVEVREHAASPDEAEAGRVRIAGFSGDGVVLLPGDAFEATLPGDAGGAELFATTACAGGPSAGPEPLVFRVLLDDAEVARFEEPFGVSASATARTLALPADAGGRLLRVEVTGPPAVAALFTPRVGPADPRAAGDARPDVVVFVADTYRADNLACYGGDPRIAPRLNAFAEESLRFLRAWSPSSWTLPSHAALFSGLYPYQSTVVGFRSALPAEVETLAERFQAAGYRTGAVTDSACVSAAYGLDQGFEWFDEEHAGPRRTLDAVARFLDGDDGRPQLLFVQSYVAHGPYVVGAEAARRTGGSEVERSESDALARRLRAVQGTERDRLPADDHAAALALEAMYRGSSAELDRLFGDVLDLLAGRGLGDAAVLVTSDHGEAFLEHGLLEHGTGTYEELTRIPLLIRAAGIEPGDRLDAASLVDLPLTAAELADVAPARGWGGRSLIAPPSAAGPVFAFECDVDGGSSTVAVVDGELKMIAPMVASDGGASVLEPVHVFDLAADPRERVDLSATPEAWHPSWNARAVSVERLLRPQAAPASARPGGADLEVLRRLGYAGD